MTSKINMGTGITIRSEDVKFPTFAQRIKFAYGDKDAFLIITHEYESAMGYYVSAEVEVDGETLGELQEDDGWQDYVYSLFNGTFMANRHRMELPRPLITMMEKRCEMLTTQAAET